MDWLTQAIAHLDQMERGARARTLEADTAATAAEGAAFDANADWQAIREALKIMQALLSAGAVPEVPT
jgi:hypothetical protein